MACRHTVLREAIQAICFYCKVTTMLMSICGFYMV